MELKSGYKQTEVGIIPEDWEVRGLLNTVRIATGQVDPKTEPYRSMILVAPDHIEGGTGKLLVMRTAAEQQAISGKYVFQAGDIVYSKIRPYLRKATLAEFDGLCSADMYPLKPATDISASFILAILLSHRFTKYAESVSVRSGMPKINRAEMDDFEVAVPPLPEQRAIADALNDVDRLLSWLDRLIAKKHDLKEATMQQLLTGQTRLPGFHGEWAVRQLGKICGRITTGKLDANAMVEDGDYPFFTCAKENYWIDRYAFDTEALLVSGNGANVGYVHYYKGKFNAYQRTYVISEFSADAIFLRLFLDRNLRDRIRVEVNAGNTPYITMGTLTEMEVVLPTLAEQAAIAAVLSDMDAEIAALEQRREKTRALKQAMMQELLTGKTRLVAAGDSHARTTSL
jgi:type I restriction enzyme S subunit